MPTAVRPATDADLPALLALYAELHPDDQPPTAQDAHRAWQAITAQAGRAILVAEAGGSVVGTADCTTLPNLTRQARPFLLVENVVVTATHRRAGIGAALMEGVVALAEEAGCYKIQLLSRATRHTAHAFYESCGFQAVAQGYRRYLD
jgi:GNAT superfamily N-acetyltransferase